MDVIYTKEKRECAIVKDRYTEKLTKRNSKNMKKETPKLFLEWAGNKTVKSTGFYQVEYWRSVWRQSQP